MFCQMDLLHLNSQCSMVVILFLISRRLIAILMKQLRGGGGR